MTHSRHRTRRSRVRCRLHLRQGPPRPRQPDANVLNESFRSWEVLNDPFKTSAQGAAPVACAGAAKLGDFAGTLPREGGGCVGEGEQHGWIASAAPARTS